MLPLRNRDELAEQAQVVPLIEQVALCISSGAPVRTLEREYDTEAKDLPGWVVFADAEGLGIGVNLADFVPSVTPLRRKINAVHHARKVVDCFTNATQPFPLFLQDEWGCPEDWRVFRVSVRAGSFLCAVSYPIPPLAFTGIHVAHRAPRVHLPFVAEIPWHSDISPGASQRLSKVRVSNTEQRIHGNLFLSSEGIMSIETSAAEQEIARNDASDIIMRVDLGEVQLPLEQLSALRSGSVIELDAQLPVTCFLRVGTTTLAQGELVLDEEGLRLTIKEVIK